MNPKEMTVTELKAVAFDILVEIERHQKNLQIINQEIASRPQESNGKSVEAPKVVPKEAVEGEK